MRLGGDLSVVPGVDLRLDQGCEEFQVRRGEQIALSLGHAPARAIADARATKVALEHGRVDPRDEELAVGLDINDRPLEARLLDDPETAG